MDNKIVLYDVADKVNTEEANTKRIASTRDENGQKWYLFLARGKDGEYHELVRSVYLQSIFDVCLNQNMMVFFPSRVRDTMRTAITPKTFSTLFCDEKLEAENQIKAEEEILSEFFIED